MGGKRGGAAVKHPCHGKVRYGSYDEAGLALVDCKIRASLHGNRNKQKRREQRQYWCGDCDGFHLSSSPGEAPWEVAP